MTKDGFVDILNKMIEDEILNEKGLEGVKFYNKDKKGVFQWII